MLATAAQFAEALTRPELTAARTAATPALATRADRWRTWFGVAAGMAAVFRTPLGAALLAVEILHRDDFESDALVPSVLASVVAYSVFIAFFGELTLFKHAPSYPFHPVHLPLYALLAVSE